MSNIIQLYTQTNNPHIFGWIPDNNRTNEQKEKDRLIRASWPEFKLYGNGYWKQEERSRIHECVLALRKKHLPAFYQEVGSCFPAGSPVYMGNGTYKPIENIKIGDEVITHLGNTKKVTELFNRPYTGELYSIDIQGFKNDFRMTSDHLLYVIENISKRADSGRYSPGEGKWVPANKIKPGDRVLIPYGNEFSEYLEINLLDYLRDEDYTIINNRIHIKNVKFDNSLPIKIKVDENFARLIGLYLAEGGKRKTKFNKICGLDFSFCYDEEIYAQEVINLIESIFGIKAIINKVKSKKTVIGVRCNASSLGRFFSNFIDADLYNKYVPQEFFKSPKTVKIALLRGWLDGDGYKQFENRKNKKYKYLRINGISASRKLIDDMSKIAISCNIKPNIILRKKAKHQRVAATCIDFYGNETYSIYQELQEKANEINWKPKSPKFYRNGIGFICEVKKVDYLYVVDMPVYNFEVQDDHSYVINNVAVHNCVGQGKAKCEWYLMYVEKVLKGDKEIPIMPFEPYGYAQSRVCGGISGMEDGSFGSAAAEAAKKYGVLSSELSGLPSFKTNSETVTWPGKIDREWGNRGSPQQWITEGQKHLVKTTAVLKNHDDAVAALANGYPITIASDWGGMMTPPIVSGVRLNKRVTQWMHQMQISDFWFHPQLQLIFYVNNSWGENAHGDSPDNSPPGGFWITKDEFNYIARQNEAIAYSNFDGFPEQRLDKALFMLYS